jgi:hypothetical protein
MSFHTVGEKRRNKNRPPKSRTLETIENYTIIRDGSMFRIDRDSVYLTYRATQSEAHEAIAEDRARLLAAAVKITQQKAAA